MFFILATVAVAGWQAEIDLITLIQDFPRAASKLSHFWPPLVASVPELIGPCLVTIGLALVPLPIGVAISIPIAFAAAKNISPSALRFLTRAYITFQRNFPEIILVLVLVRAFGIGPLPGIIAIALGTTGMLSKLIADAIEEIDGRVFESLRATGASQWQIIRYGVLPEVMPAIIANSLFRFEINIRQAGLLGAVGAGGIGFELDYALNNLEYGRATMTIIMLLLLILGAERVSDFLRRRILVGDRLK
jgi:phosphonate transport system permease protein